jgi:TM2 domain-containing membrane protein YozV
MTEGPQLPQPYSGDPWQPPQPPQPTQPYQPPPPGYGYPVVPYGGYVHPAAPFGVHPVTGRPYSDKSKATAGLLQLLLPLLSICGVGRLYAGHVGIGLVQLIGMFVAWFFSFFLIGIPFLIGIWLWTVIDGIVILAGESTDGHGRLLR